MSVFSRTFHVRSLGLLSGAFFAILVWMTVDFGARPETGKMAAVAVLMSVFWVTEAIPLAATALLPLALFPFLGISSSKLVAAQYMNSTVFLLFGGFLIALAMQKWGLHKRMALLVLSCFSKRPALLVVGFQIATAGLSMWISNTATTLMMMPIAIAIIDRYKSLLDEAQTHRFSVALLLSIAYSASIGGMVTLIGTAPNLVFARFYELLTGESMGFLQWMIIAFPVSLVLILSLGLFLGFFYIKNLPFSKDFQQIIKEERVNLGGMRYEEIMVLLVFCLTCLLWITRKGFYLNGFEIQGWAELLGLKSVVDDGSVAIAMAICLFLIPAGGFFQSHGRLLDEEVFKMLPWSIIVLFGGGFALAFGFSESGLSSYLAGQLQLLKNMDLPVMVFCITAGMSLLTELTSNTATTQLILPVLKSTAEALHVSPVLLMLPATFAASAAFMFPVATPPNAIVFGSGKVKIKDMIVLGAVMNAVAVCAISFLSFQLYYVFYSS